MAKSKRMYVDQWGGRFFASTVKELRSQIGGGGSRASKMYRDKKDGSVVHVGYVVGEHWLTGFIPMEVKQ